MNSANGIFYETGQAKGVALKLVPRVDLKLFQEGIFARVDGGDRVAALFGKAADHTKKLEIVGVLCDDQNGIIRIGRTLVEKKKYPSMTVGCPQLHLFERELAEIWGLDVQGHPGLKPLRYPVTNAESTENRKIPPGGGDFFRVEGDSVHEVAVGPIHAGVIEPGHFRFQCHGEEVFHLEIALGYQHRGVEAALAKGPNKRSVHYAETLCGDSSIAHTLAYSRVVEALSGTRVSARGHWLRGIALELERIANHVGDLGALSQDAGYLPTASFCGKLRGDFLNLTAQLCGSRFGRGFVRPGGIGFDVDDADVKQLLSRLKKAENPTRQAVSLLWDTPSVVGRFEDTGTLPHNVAVDLGVVGMAARASGLRRDSRHDYPDGVFRFVQIPVHQGQRGDIYSRAHQRWLEVEQSIKFVREQLRALPAGDVRMEATECAADSIAVSLVEGWRGECCHVGITGNDGKFESYKVVDPSFHNWAAMAYVLRGQQISDFPLCNKSFNLSYCGHDL